MKGISRYKLCKLKWCMSKDGACFESSLYALLNTQYLTPKSIFELLKGIKYDML